jgi:hypothetical protein
LRGGTQASHAPVTATLHCFIGCNIGEALGLLITTALGWGDVAAIVLAVFPAFVFGAWETVSDTV